MYSCHKLQQHEVKHCKDCVGRAWGVLSEWPESVVRVRIDMFLAVQSAFHGAMRRLPLWPLERISNGGLDPR